MSRALLAIGLVLVVAACARSDLRNLDGTRWEAVRIVDIAAVPTPRPMIAFDDVGASGLGLCSTYAIETLSIDLSTTPPRLKVGSSSRSSGCLNDAWVRIDEVFMDALLQADTIELVGEQLVVSGPAGMIIFDRLPGTT